MKPSYRLVDYSLRPAKFAERKMLCELFSRLPPFSPMQQYRYVGLGSIVRCRTLRPAVPIPAELRTSFEP